MLMLKGNRQVDSATWVLQGRSWSIFQVTISTSRQRLTLPAAPSALIGRERPGSGSVQAPPPPRPSRGLEGGCWGTIWGRLYLVSFHFVLGHLSLPMGSQGSEKTFHDCLNSL